MMKIMLINISLPNLSSVWHLRMRITEYIRTSKDYLASFSGKIYTLNPTQSLGLGNVDFGGGFFVLLVLLSWDTIVGICGSEEFYFFCL